LRDSQYIPAEPDWNAHFAYWDNYFRSSYKPPKKGQIIDIVLLNDIIKRGQFVSITNEFVTIDIDKGTITFTRNQIRQDCRDRLFKDEYTKAKAIEKVKEEKAVYVDGIRYFKHKSTIMGAVKKLKDHPPPPLRLVALYTSWNTIGEREVELKVGNISSYAIVAYEATIACFDRFGDPVRGFLDDSNEVKLLCQDRIEPGMTKNTKWTLHFRDTATVKRVRIDRIKLANGTIWTPALGNEIHEEYHDK